MGWLASPATMPVSVMMVAFRLPAPRSMPSRYASKVLPFNGESVRDYHRAMADTIELDPGLIAKRVSMTEIPVIDIAPLLHGDAQARADVARPRSARPAAISGFSTSSIMACRTRCWSHAVYAQAKRFFDQPEAAKAGDRDREIRRAIAAISKSAAKIWTRQNRRQAGDLKEGIKIGRDLAAEPSAGAGRHAAARAEPMAGKSAGLARR